VSSQEQLFTRILTFPSSLQIHAQRPGVLDATHKSVCILRDTCVVPQCTTPCMLVTSQAGAKQSPPPRLRVLGPTGASATPIHAVRVPNRCLVPPTQNGIRAPRTSSVNEPTVVVGVHVQARLLGHTQAWV
jgi:hypothetical protein